MARYRRGDGDYVDVECAYPKLERYLGLSCNIGRFAGHHEARQARVGSVAGVTAIMLIANVILQLLY